MTDTERLRKIIRNADKRGKLIRKTILRGVLAAMLIIVLAGCIVDPWPPLQYTPYPPPETSTPIIETDTPIPYP